MAILGLDYYLCEACKWFDTDGEDGNHPYCVRQFYVDINPSIAVRLGDECPFGYEFGVPSGYPVSKENNERRAYEIKAMLDGLKPCPFCGCYPAIDIVNAEGGVGIFCSNIECVCFRCGNTFSNTDQAIAAWNKRSEQCGSREMERIKDENAKLRELVKDLYEWEPDDHPTLRNLSFYNDKDTGVHRRMRDLGIEV